MSEPKVDMLDVAKWCMSKNESEPLVAIAHALIALVERVDRLTDEAVKLNRLVDEIGYAMPKERR